MSWWRLSLVRDVPTYIIHNGDVATASHTGWVLLSETKRDDLFPTAQFLLNSFCKPYRLDHSSRGRGILLYVRDDIPFRLLADYKMKETLKLFFVEVDIRKKKKWLPGCSYNPHKNNISNHIHHLNKGLDVYLKSYDNILIMGDLNSDLKLVKTVWMVYAMLTASKLLIELRLASKIPTIRHIFNRHTLLKRVFLTSTKWLLL